MCPFQWQKIFRLCTVENKNGDKKIKIKDSACLNNNVQKVEFIITVNETNVYFIILPHFIVNFIINML